jgi:hypothetical protein
MAGIKEIKIETQASVEDKPTEIKIKSKPSLGYTYNIQKCSCGEEILVERLLLGVDHTANTMARHKKCLKLPLNKKFIDDHPEEAEEITNWLKGEK